MTGPVFFSLCVIFTLIHSTVQLSCGSGEIKDDCPSNCRDSCPVIERQHRDCFTPGFCGKPKCMCSFNRRRAPNGACVDTRLCPPFKCDRPNEEYVACPPYCPSDDCKQATPDGSCPMKSHLLIVVECSPACRCIKGYWRKNGSCVPYNQCPPNATPFPVQVNK